MDTEKILKALADNNKASEERHKETKVAVREIANEQIKANKRLDSLESTVASHGRQLSHASNGVRQNSESDATLASNLAAVATATAAQATETRALSERMTRMETALVSVPAATATATANATAIVTKGENDKLRKRMTLQPMTQALALFLGTVAGSAVVQIVKSLLGGH